MYIYKWNTALSLDIILLQLFIKKVSLKTSRMIAYIEAPIMESRAVCIILGENLYAKIFTAASIIPPAIPYVQPDNKIFFQSSSFRTIIS